MKDKSTILDTETESYFSRYRKGVIGRDARLASPGRRPVKMVYADWVASGRCYLPIENRIREEVMPWVGNTHTESSSTGAAMTHAYHAAQQIIKKHVNAAADDFIITAGSGMTRLLNKFQRILGIKLQANHCPMPPELKRPVVFITHMEHHSNQTSWLETIATVEIINPDKNGLVDMNHLKTLIHKYRERPLKIASVTACSNVTGIGTPYHRIAKLMHEAGGFCFVDFACSAPYVTMDMHPKRKHEHLDAIFFSPHKFLGGPGSAGVLIFNRKLYSNRAPDDSGGGTVDWTNPWGKHKYIDDVEAREDGGTPAFLQTIKTALCIRLKEEMGVERLLAREHELLAILWDKLEAVPNIRILATQHRKRLAIVSFYIDELHYSLGVRLLNDRFGIQCRGGCLCAGTYGHYLLNVDQETSQKITDLIDQGDFSAKPGWMRISLHPVMTNKEVEFIGDCIVKLAKHHSKWSADYLLDAKHGHVAMRDAELDAGLKKKMSGALSDPFIRQ